MDASNWHAIEDGKVPSTSSMRAWKNAGHLLAVLDVLVETARCSRCAARVRPSHSATATRIRRLRRSWRIVRGTAPQIGVASSLLARPDERVPATQPIRTQPLPVR